MVVAMRRAPEAAEEFSEALRRHQTQLFGYIYSLVRDFNDADDLFQQTSLVLWKKFAGYDRTKSFVVWACGVARLEAANFLRSRDRRRRHFGGALAALLVEDHAALEHDRLEDRREALAECMKRLRPPDRELLEACYGGTADVAEVARVQGRPASSVHNSLRRIRRSLFACVGRALGLGPGGGGEA
jgi:RNA polymerase sigma-70 factor (ECF subfamily)